MKSARGQSASDQLFYDNEPLASPAEHAAWMHEIEFYFLGYADRLNEALAGTAGIVAELGAGSCGLSLCLSRLSSVKSVRSLDISTVRMERMLARSHQVLGGDLGKIMPVKCDFNTTLPFENEALDAILFDAALHHSRSMWNTLSECHRVLRYGGVLIAQRESYLSTFRAGRQLQRLLRTPEVVAEVSENMYLKDQYEYYLRVNGFTPIFMGRSRDRLKSVLSFLNGIAFCDGTLFCRKQ